MTNELVSVVVPTWNSEDTVAACLDSVLAQEWPCLETLVVDNGSKDRTLAILERSKGIRTLLLPRNMGFARACNVGIEHTRGDFVLLLNADTVLAPDCLARVVPELIARPEAGSAAPKILQAESNPPRIDSTGIVLNRRCFSPADRGQNEADAGQYAVPGPVFGPTGAAALYRRSALDDVSVDGEYMDEDFFAYYEDVDLAWRLQLRGWRSLYVPTAAARHGRRGPHRQPIMVAARAYFNRYFCYLKNERRANLGDYSVRGVLREVARVPWHVVRRPHLLLGIPRAVALLPRMWRKRRQIQRMATATPEQIRHF